MSILFFISFLLVVAGCGSKHAYKGELQGAAPIAGTESFYAFASNEVTKARQTLIRLEPDGSFRPIREVDGSLWMRRRVADTSFVVQRDIKDTLYLYSVASGELSTLPDGEPYDSHWRVLSDRTRDSLGKDPLLKDIDVFYIYALYAKDRYLIHVNPPGGYPLDGGFLEGGSAPAEPEHGYLTIADMRKKTLTQIPGEFIECFSSSEKSVLVWDYEGGDAYLRIVNLAEILE
jgi:hypothetical protein